jgi:hypothetical protein
MDYDIFKVRSKNYTVKAQYDEHPIDPREANDNFGTMICFHRHYKLGDSHSITPDRLNEIIQQPGVISKPLYLYDHGGLTMNTGGFTCRFDSGKVGYIYTTMLDIKNNFMIDEVTPEYIEKSMQLLESEVKEYDRYLRGDQYCVIVQKKKYNPDKNEIDLQYIFSCGGYDSLHYAITDAAGYIEGDSEMMEMLEAKKAEYVNR